MKKLGNSRIAKAANAGFTIIELIVVILLLGILSATALPRFIDVTASAHDAAVRGVYGGLATGVALFKAQVTAGGLASGALVSQFNSLPTTSDGFPAIASLVSTGSTGNLASCANIWTGLLQGGRPNLTNNLSLSAPQAGGISLAIASTFQVAVVGTTDCVYAYTARGVGVAAQAIIYNAATGEVSLSTSYL